MIKARIRWCTCRVENILTLGKLLSLWFCFYFVFYISTLIVHTLISSYELARPIMGTIFLVYIYVCMSLIVGRAKRAPHRGVQSRFRVIYIYKGMSVVCQINYVGGIIWPK